MEAQEALHEGCQPLPVVPKELRDRSLFIAMVKVEAAFALPLTEGNGGPSLPTDLAMLGRAQQAPIKGVFMQEAGEGYGWYQRSECLPTLSCLCGERFSLTTMVREIGCLTTIASPTSQGGGHMVPAILHLNQGSPDISQTSSRSYSSVEKKGNFKKAEI